MTETLLVGAVIAPMHAEARVSSVQVSQRLAGHAVTVLASDGDWRRVRGEDGYEGWMHRGYLETPPATGLTSSAPLLSLGCTARHESRGVTRTLPLGAWVRAGERVIDGFAVDDATRERIFPRDGAVIGATAVERFAGTPYQWGGITTWGADCSGLVQTTFWLHGVALPRDAWQQAEVGRDAGTDATRWEPADLAFFSDRPDRRITHVGIALGGARMVHLALGRGGYAVERLTACDDAYVASLMSRLVVARRVL
jgi:gamma-D-glutamyl-L-lysine dipeptidyl-peptidase